MFVNANIKFHFDFNRSEDETQAEFLEGLEDIIRCGDYFPEQIVECEVEFYE